MTRLATAAAAAAAGTIRVDVVSDAVCPWCYVGKRRLEQAIQQVPNINVEVRWHPYQLNPTASEHGENKRDMYKAKFGEARMAQMLPYMTQTMAELGVKYSLGGLTGNTYNSHRLIHWAGEEAGWEKQNALVEELFQNYFSQEKFINDREVLLAAVAKVGLDPTQAAGVLDGQRPDVDAAVKRELSRARQQGISGVPHFTINNKYQVSGAQPAEEFVSMLQEVARTLQPAAPAAAPAAGPAEATACGRDGACA